MRGSEAGDEGIRCSRRWQLHSEAKEGAPAPLVAETERMELTAALHYRVQECGACDARRFAKSEDGHNPKEGGGHLRSWSHCRSMVLRGTFRGTSTTHRRCRSSMSQSRKPGMRWTRCRASTSQWRRWSSSFLQKCSHELVNTSTPWEISLYFNERRRQSSAELDARSSASTEPAFADRDSARHSLPLPPERVAARLARLDRLLAARTAEEEVEEHAQEEVEEQPSRFQGQFRPRSHCTSFLSGRHCWRGSSCWFAYAHHELLLD